MSRAWVIATVLAAGAVGVQVAGAAPVAITSEHLTVSVDPAVSVPIPTPSTCTLAPVADSYVRSGLQAALNFDGSKLLRAGPSLLSLALGDQRSMLRFDTSGACPESGNAIPAGSTIVTASLELFLETAPLDSRTHQLRRITSAWNETTVTWNTQPSVTPVASTVSTGTTAGVWRTWSVTADVRAFAAGSLVNNGWEIDDAAEGSILSALSVTDYCGRSGGATTACGTSGADDRRPRLVIGYLAP
jgi:hypothetical protein